MRVYLSENVLEMAKRRIRWCFDEFDRLCVNVSGGKGSTVVFELAYRAAQRRDQPLYCMWIDQEAEYQSTVEVVEEWMTRDGVEPVWMQCPMKMTNATSDEEEFLDVWGEDADWMREKHPLSITENTFGTQRFTEMFEEILWQHVAEENPKRDVCAFGGVRAEESPARYLGMINSSVRKGVTYGKTTDYPNISTIYPIYDWSYSDVWHFIHSNDIDYNDIYDAQYQQGKQIRDMRVSNLNHETAIKHLFTLQEAEPETWNKLAKRLDGVHMAGQMDDDYVPDELPYMFSDWREYRNYLLEHAVDDETHERHFKRELFTQDLMSEHLSESQYATVCRAHARGILTNDWEGDSVLANAKRQIAYPETKEIMKRKKDWLKSERPDIWNQLQDKGIVRFRSDA